METTELKNQFGECQEHHHNKHIEYICTLPSQKIRLKCTTCIKKERIEPNNLIKIEDILNSNNKTVFENFPLFNDDAYLISEMKQIINREPSIETNKQRISEFFDSTKDMIITLMDQLKKEALEEAVSHMEFSEKVMNMYNQVSMKEELKKVISNTSLSGENKCNELKEILRNMSYNQTTIHETIKQQLNDFKSQELQVSLEKPQRILSQVLDQLKGMKLFDLEYHEGRKNISMEFVKTNYYDSQQLIIEKVVENDTTCQLIRSSIENGHGFSYFMSQQLDTNVAYVFRMSFNRPINLRPSCIIIGLMNTDMESMVPNARFSSVNDEQVHIIKGENLQSEQLMNSITSLEFRVCIANKEFLFADYPHYQNINAAPKNRFIGSNPEYFTVYLENPGENLTFKMYPIQIMQDRTQLPIFN